MSESHRVALVTIELELGVTSQTVFPGFPWRPGCHGYDGTSFVSDTKTGV